MGRKEAPPRAWMVSRICEEFQCLPSAAERELRRHSEVMRQVLELRAYRDAFQLVRDKDATLPDEGVNPMVDLAFVLYATGGRGRKDEDE